MSFYFSVTDRESLILLTLQTDSSTHCRYSLKAEKSLSLLSNHVKNRAIKKKIISLDYMPSVRTVKTLRKNGGVGTEKKIYVFIF